MTQLEHPDFMVLSTGEHKIMTTPLENKSSLEEIRKRVDNDISNVSLMSRRVINAFENFNLFMIKVT